MNAAAIQIGNPFAERFTVLDALGAEGLMRELAHEATR